MEKFVATIGRRWTFMEHMELPAYRDGLLVVYDRCRFPVVFQKSSAAPSS